MMNRHNLIHLYLIWVMMTALVGITFGIVTWTISYDWYSKLPLILVVASILVGVSQWLVLSHLFTNIKVWTLATAVGGIVGYIFGWVAAVISAFILGRIGDWFIGPDFGDILGGAAGWIVGGLVAGIILGIAQWLVFRVFVKKAYKWILVTAISCSIAAIVGANVNRVIGSFGSIGGFVTSVLVTVIFGAITGITLIGFVKNIENERSRQ